MLNHSGGCPGADMEWELECKKYGIKTISYSFYNHVQEGENQVLLTVNELNEGWEAVVTAEKTLKRGAESVFYPYIRNLMSRNWFQVKNSEAVFAVGIIDGNVVSGGTGWTVQMALDTNKECFFFEQNINEWLKFDYDTQKFKLYNSIPNLTNNFAGVGTRKINDNGINAIHKILKYKLRL